MSRRGRGIRLADALKRMEEISSYEPKDPMTSFAVSSSSVLETTSDFSRLHVSPSITFTDSDSSESLSSGSGLHQAPESEAGPSGPASSDITSETSGFLTSISKPKTGFSAGRGSIKKLLFSKTQLTPHLSSESESSIVSSSSCSISSTDSESGTFFDDGVKSEAIQPSKKEIGKEGTEIQVAANYIRIHVEPNKRCFLYNVRFEPQIDSSSLCIKVLNQQNIKNILGNVMNYSGTILFLPKVLEKRSMSFIGSHPVDPYVKVFVTIKFVKQPSHEELIPFYNSLFNRILSELKLVRINRNHYDPESRIIISQNKLEVWSGHICAIQEYDGGLMMNCDTTHRVLRTVTANQIIKEIYRQNPMTFKETALKKLVGSIVLTKYNNKPYRIDDIDFTQNPLFTFTMKNGEEITYCTYFKRNWGIEIKDHYQPLLIHRPKTRIDKKKDNGFICLIPELSYMTGLTDDIRSDTRAMKDLDSHTKLKPHVRLSRINNLIERINSNAATRKILDDWGLKLESNPIQLKARNLMQERLMFGIDSNRKNKIINVSPKSEWSYDVKNSNLISSVRVDKWLLVCSNLDTAKADEFVRILQQVTKRMGFGFANPKKIEIRDDVPSTYSQAIRENYAGAQLVTVMTPGSSQREDRYNEIKKMCCAEIGLISQIIRCGTLSGDKIRSVCQNIALQITCKLGGVLWRVQIPYESCMIIGLDVYHDNVKTHRSIVGVVASINQHVTQWYSKCYIQERSEEIASTLRPAIVTALKKYHEVNNCLPFKIFVYRDGVSDGQIPIVREHEIPQIEKAIDAFAPYYKDKRPSVIYVVVQKRINMKMMIATNSEYKNPPPGSVVDHTITKKNFNDFFLISQNVSHSTVTPTHYVVVFDTINLEPDKIQKLTYRLCHLYYNFPGTIRVPAPCQYAHRLAYLIGQNVRAKVKEEICDKLYFL